LKIRFKWAVLDYAQGIGSITKACQEFEVLGLRKGMYRTPTLILVRYSKPYTISSICRL
jgi:hypothetical protein